VAFPGAASAQFAPAVAPQPAPIFRPGTAGGPFGWSSAIADFNADGRPDIAVADRVGGLGSSFRIEFQLSNGPRQFVSFASAHTALTVTAVDVDNDHDIDLVVTPVLSRHVIGVWLNDGSGHFRRGRTRDLPALPSQLSPASISGQAPQLSLATSTPRRMSALSPSAARAPAISVADRIRPAASTDLPQRFLASALAPRAPPTRS
jgi:hypothetical protein